MVLKKLALVALMLAGPLAGLKLISLAFHNVAKGQWGTGFALVAAAGIVTLVLPLIAMKQNKKLEGK